jgi:rare lipoprotein A
MPGVFAGRLGIGSSQMSGEEITVWPWPDHAIATVAGRLAALPQHSLERLLMIGRSFVAVCLLCYPLAAPSHAETGVASIYNMRGNRTASGERADPSQLTAAHRWLPFGTRVTVTNNSNGRMVVVRINDRGPFVRGRIIDLTPAAAQQLGFSGITRVTISAN